MQNVHERLGRLYRSSVGLVPRPLLFWLREGKVLYIHAIEQGVGPGNGYKKSMLINIACVCQSFEVAMAVFRLT